MEPTLSFTCSTKSVSELFRQMKIGLNSKTTIKLNILPGEVEFHVPGIITHLKAETNGHGTVTFPAAYISRLLKAHSKPHLEIKFTKDRMSFDGFSVSGVQRFDYGEANVQKEVNLFINYSDKDLLLLPVKHSEPYLIANGLQEKVEKARQRKQQNIEKAWEILKTYGVKQADIENLVEKSIFGPFE